MEVVSFVVLILLSLVGYSGGAVSRAGVYAEIKPQIFDLILVFCIWAGAIYTRVTYDINKWLMIFFWIVLSFVLGMLSATFRRSSLGKHSAKREAHEKVSSSIFKAFWIKWKSFSKSMGGFQSRIILSLFYFVVVTPFALGLKVLSDPLRIKNRSSRSYWLMKEETPTEFEDFRRQF